MTTCNKKSVSRKLTLVLALGTLSICGGCQNSPSRVDTPNIDATSAAAEAVKLYDKNGDALLSDSELAAEPVLHEQLKQLDTGGDGFVDASEIATAIESWQATGVGLVMGYRCRVYLKGRPLEGAEVTMEPVPFLKEDLSPIRGTTENMGIAGLAIPEEELPSDMKGISAAKFGWYRVKIEHPSVEVPAKYNTATTLGCEIYPSGDPEIYTFRLD